MEIAHRALMLKVLNTLNEAQARWYVAKEAVALGRGGLRAMHHLTGMSRPAILDTYDFPRLAVGTAIPYSA